MLMGSWDLREGVRVSQSRDASTLPVELQVRPFVVKGPQMILESTLRESVVNI